MAAEAHGKAPGDPVGGCLMVIFAIYCSCVSVFRSMTWCCFAGLSNGDAPASESDTFRKTSEQLVKYMNSGNRSLHKNLLKQEVVQRFLRLLSSLQGNFSHNIQLVKDDLCSLKLFSNIV